MEKEVHKVEDTLIEWGFLNKRVESEKDFTGLQCTEQADIYKSLWIALYDDDGFWSDWRIVNRKG